eukprot:1192268-Prorocentrum_minimum.AAC.1
MTRAPRVVAQEHLDSAKVAAKEAAKAAEARARLETEGARNLHRTEATHAAEAHKRELKQAKEVRIPPPAPLAFLASSARIEAALCTGGGGSIGAPPRTKPSLVGLLTNLRRLVVLAKSLRVYESTPQKGDEKNGGVLMPHSCRGRCSSRTVAPRSPLFSEGGLGGAERGEGVRSDQAGGADRARPAGALLPDPLLKYRRRSLHPCRARVAEAPPAPQDPKVIRRSVGSNGGLRRSAW